MIISFFPLLMATSRAGGKGGEVGGRFYCSALWVEVLGGEVSWLVPKREEGGWFSCRADRFSSASSQFSLS